MIDKKIVKGFIKSGFNVLPLKTDKRPDIKSWAYLQKELYNVDLDHEFQALGLICGDISGGVETIDLDIKYDNSGSLYEDLKGKIDLFSPGLWEKFVIQKTVNDGFHLIYRCKEIGTNVKLAEREATKEEKEDGHKKLVLIETRGSGGYIVCTPSEGYKIVSDRKLRDIQTITPEERNILFSCCRMFDQMMPPVFQENPNVHWESKGIPPWTAFNDKGDWKSVLEKHGWTIVKETDQKTFVKRPGAKSPMSGNFDHSYNLLRVFSSSSIFDPDKSYNPFMIYTILECGGDVKQAARELKELGYGYAPESQFKRVDEEVDLTIEDDFVSGKEDDDILEDYAENKMPVGHSTGYPMLDDHFLLKEGTFNIIAGHANLGKSTVAWNMAAAAYVKNKWKSIIYSPENNAWSIKLMIIQFMTGKDIKKTTKEQRKKALEHINNNIKIIETEDMMSFYDVLQYAEKLMKKDEYKILLIDPYSALKYDYNIPGIDRKFSTYEYHYAAASMMKNWSKANNCNLMLTLHGVTEAQRKVYPDKDKELAGHIKPLMAADVEFGAMWINRASDFIVVHRLIHHEEHRNKSQIHVRKIKEEFSGGKPTPLNEPVILKMKNPGFFGFYDEDDNNPFVDWSKKHILGEQEETKELTDTEKLNQFEQQAVAELAYSRGATFRNVSLEDDEPPF